MMKCLFFGNLQHLSSLARIRSHGVLQIQRHHLLFHLSYSYRYPVASSAYGCQCINLQADLVVGLIFVVSLAFLSELADSL